MEKETYCLACRKYTKNNNPKVVRNDKILIAYHVKTKNNRKMMLSRCSIYNNKKSTFISEGSGLFDSLGLNTPQNRMKKCFMECF